MLCTDRWLDRVERLATDQKVGGSRAFGEVPPRLERDLSYQRREVLSGVLKRNPCFPMEVIWLFDQRLEAGYQQVVWNGRDTFGRQVPSGIYIAKLITPQYSNSIKMVLLR